MTMTMKQLYSSVFVNPRTHQWVRLLGPSQDLERLLSLPSSSSSSMIRPLPTPSQSPSNNNNNNNNAHQLLMTKIIKEANGKLLQRQQQQEWYRVQIGLTQRGLDDVGDISHVERMISNGRNRQEQPIVAQEINRRQEFLKIVHEGHAITAADEMYHTVWDTIKDEVSIVSPVNGWISDTNSDVDEDGDEILRYIDEETILMDVISSNEDVERVFPLSFQQLNQEDTTSSDTTSDPIIRRSTTGDNGGGMGDDRDQQEQQLFVHERDYFNLVVPSLPPGKYAEDQ